MWYGTQLPYSFIYEQYSGCHVYKKNGGISHLNELTREIWLWGIDRNIWLSSYHWEPNIRRPTFSQERVTKTLNGAFITETLKKSKIILVFVILIYSHLRKTIKLRHMLRWNLIYMPLSLTHFRYLGRCLIYAIFSHLSAYLA